MSGAGPRRERGQGLVEFALILPVLLLTVLLFIYFAGLFHTWSGMQSAAVAGARHASDTGSTTGIGDVVAQTLAAQSVEAGDVQVLWTVRNADGSARTCAGPCPLQFGDLVAVQVVKPFTIGVLDWQATGELRASHEVRAQHGAWLP